MITNKRSLPNLIIAGVNKSGTTSLYRYLAEHPEICASFTKEIRYFLPLMFDKPISPIGEYEKHFAHCENQRYRMEASPNYLFGKEKIAGAIREFVPDAKVIVILRDPTDRLLSLFTRAVSNSQIPDDMTLRDYISISQRRMHDADYNVFTTGVREGMYIRYIRPWREIFDDNLKIVFFDDLQKSASRLTFSICEWLELDTTKFRNDDFSVENKTLQYRFKGLHRLIRDLYMRNETFWRKHHKSKQRLRTIYNTLNVGVAKKLRTIDDATVAELRDFYAPFNSQLKSFLDLHGYDSLPGWLD